jgi:hypothetical protein
MSTNKSFKEVKEELSKVGDDGKAKKLYSRTDFDALTTALINTPDYEVEHVGMSKGEVVTKSTKPIQEFRGYVKKVLIDFGVDKIEAENIMTDYKFPKATGIYPLITSAITEYCDTGKKFTFPTERDMQASIFIDRKPKQTKQYKSIKKEGVEQEVFDIMTEEYRCMKASSKTPKWLKKKLK